MLTENELRDGIRESLIAADIQAVHEECYPDAKCIERRNYWHRCYLLLLPSDIPSYLKGDPNWRAAGYWLEIKRVSQFLESGSNWWYEHALLEAIPQDIYKLAKDSKIFYAGLLLVLFSANSRSGNYDLKYGSSAPLTKEPLGAANTPVQHYQLPRKWACFYCAFSASPAVGIRRHRLINRLPVP